ncbi:MAG TPA: respiratory chain complex I subunit 1 family protein [Bacteroidota bacterium]
MQNILTNALLLILQLAITILTAPLIAGIIKKTKARIQNRRGPSILQPYADLTKLLKKEVVISENASWLFSFTPYLLIASTLVIVLLVPTVYAPLPFHWIGDIIAVAYFLALGRFFLALAGLDAASGFGGLGSSREMSIASIVEPAMMLSIFAVAVTAGSTNLSIVVRSLSTTPASIFNPSHILAFVALFIVTIAETGRIPVDNPETHLELTMIHEAMILEYSGRYLAFIEWAAQMKMVVFLSLLVNLFFPIGLATELSPAALGISVVAFVGKMTILAVGIALVESTNAKLRLFRVPDLLMTAFILALLSLILYFIIGA